MENKVLTWLTSKRGSRSVKVLCGVRGVGKTRMLAAWRDGLVREGYPEDRIVSVNAEDPALCLACFGLVPDFERRAAQNARWLELRRASAHVYLSVGGSQEFVVPRKGG